MRNVIQVDILFSQSLQNKLFQVLNETFGRTSPASPNDVPNCRIHSWNGRIARRQIGIRYLQVNTVSVSANFGPDASFNSSFATDIVQINRATSPLTASAVLLFTLAAGAGAEACDKQRGEKVFKKCAACHSLDDGVHKAGPSLNRVFGRDVGRVEGFRFSKPMAEADLSWDTETLSAFLKNPREFLPGSVMPFRGLVKDQDRHALLCWLQSATAAQSSN